MSAFVLTLLVFQCLAVREIVHVDQGDLRGVADESLDLISFLNVPYAEPPIGQLRFAPTVPKAPWDGILDATQFGNICPQNSSGAGPFPPGVGPSEDCLYLNIWAPLGATNESRLPVMLWIHGGSFRDGSGNLLYYHGTNLTQQSNVVVVTINYRLGPLGFLGLSELQTKESPTTGNYGILDQQAAMVWVNQNIAQFGGNPSEITLFGESAGASSICFHLVLPSSQGLFQQAILESPACFIECNPLQLVEAGSVALADSLGCSQNVVSCLRVLPWESFVDPLLPFTASATVDGALFTHHPYYSIVNGDFAHVPMMSGNCQNEGSLWVAPSYPEPMNETQYVEFLVAMGLPKTLIQAALGTTFYAPSADCRWAAINLITDLWFVCPGVVLADAVPLTDSYVFTHQPSWLPPAFLPWGVPHTAEIPFVFETLWASGATPTEEEVALAKQMSSAWTEFASSGRVPATWPDFSTNDRRNLNTTGPALIENWQAPQCQFWAPLFREYYYY